MVSTMTSSGYPLPKNKFLICSNSLLILLSEQILRALNVRHLIRLTLDLGAKASQLKYKPVNVGFLYILLTKVNECRSTKTSKNGNLLSFSSSIVKVWEGRKSFNRWKNDKASLREPKQAKVSSRNVNKHKSWETCQKVVFHRTQQKYFQE